MPDIQQVRSRLPNQEIMVAFPNQEMMLACFIGSQKGALEKGALKSVFWAINAAFYFDFAFISSSNGRHSSISFGYCVIINNRGCVLDAFSNSTCSFAQEGVLCFFDDHEASPFVRILCMCRAWQARRDGIRRQLGGTPSLDWDISHRQRVCWEHHDISRV